MPLDRRRHRRSTTSIVGNVLDRGVGYLSRRHDVLLGLEAVLSDGRMIRTGGWRFGDSPTAHLHAQGVGPDIGARLPQSNLAIVTAAIVGLRPAPIRPAAVICRLRHGKSLEAFVDALRDLRERKTSTSVVHIANRARSDGLLLPLLGMRLTAEQADRHALANSGHPTNTTGAPASEWSAVAAVAGSPLERAARIRAMRRAVGEFATVQMIGATRVRALAAAGRVLPRLAAGGTCPTGSACSIRDGHEPPARSGPRSRPSSRRSTRPRSLLRANVGLEP